MTDASEFANYPFLSSEEFEEACHQLDRAYCRAALGPLRRRWRLYVVTALNDRPFGFGFSGECSTFVRIRRSLYPDPDVEHGELASGLGRLALGKDDCEEGRKADVDILVLGSEDSEMVDAEEADEAALPRSGLTIDPAYVTYEIHLHPTYRAPCLWFSLHGLPSHEPALSPDTVFKHLVPDQFKDSLQKAGAIGGISIDNNPVTGVPCFFVHPCLLGDAMSSFGCSKENYLMVWLGLVGGCVGLWIPKEIALASGRS